MCDFYDIHILWSEKADIINIDTLRRAIINVARKRGTIELFDNTDEILRDIAESDYLRNNWGNYKRGSFYVGDLSWDTVLGTMLFIFKNEVGALKVSD